MMSAEFIVQGAEFFILWYIMNGEKIDQRAFNFAVRISKLYVYLKSKKLYEISSQIFRSGTSVGANIVEAQSGVSKKDFINKMNIALKEARETFYWLKILKSGFKENVDDLNLECEIIIKILVVIINKTKANLQS